MYSVSKAAATHLGRNLANELAPDFITTNIVEPGFFPSKLANGLIEVLGGTDQLEKANPLGRLGEPEDIAAVMIYICSRAGAYLVCNVTLVKEEQRLTFGRTVRVFRSMVARDLRLVALYRSLTSRSAISNVEEYKRYLKDELQATITE